MRPLKYFAVAAFILATTASSQAQVTITSTVLQSNFNGATGAGETAPIAASAFDFSGQQQLSSIDNISITFTVIDGDTGLGPNNINETPYPPDGNQHGDDDFDVNSWTLRLDMIDVGPNLLLNGFNSYDNNQPLAMSDFVTRTIMGAPSNAGAILAALQSDHQLVAQVFDSTGIAMSNGFQIPNTEIDRSTSLFATLSITGTAIPEPSIAVLFTSAVGLIGLCKLRRITKS
ncbi:MAG: hypothetical protein JWO45_889 [Spartobacteria bacterium]|nr:hypothetical protein [Spartobacteria bacterium]